MNTAKVWDSALQCLPMGSNWPLLCNDASKSLLVSGLEAQLELEWNYFPLKKSWDTLTHRIVETPRANFNLLNAKFFSVTSCGHVS